MDVQDGKSAEKKEKILDAVVKIIAEEGYQSATTRNISKKANVSHGILHYYFKDKEEIIASALEINIQRLFGYTRFIETSSPSEWLGEILVQFIKKAYSENKAYYQFLFGIWSLSWQNDRIKKIIDEWHEKVKVFITDMIVNKSNSYNINISHDLSKSIALYLMLVMDGTFLHLVQNEKLFEEEQMWTTIMKATSSVILQGKN